jgi:RNA polymerase sigma-70 factor, ECF subfamily
MSSSPLSSQFTHGKGSANAMGPHLSAMTSPLPTSEADLVARAQRSDREAFGDLYELHLEAIYRYLYYRVSDPHEAEDLTEMVFLKAWQALPRYRLAEFPFTSWLYRIAHNLLVDSRRTRKKHVMLDEGLSDGAPSPEAHLVQREQRQVLQRALACLNEQQQQVLILRFISDLSHAETAQVMGQSEGTVRVIQHRALAALRRLLAEGWNE